jgi:hypothetical protein
MIMHFTEKRVAEYFVDTVLSDPDKSISVYGEGEGPDVKRSREHFTVLDNMGQCDFDDIQVWSDNRGGDVAWFQFVYGNVTSHSEAIEVISDYSANEYGDKIVKHVEEMTS